MVGTEWVESLIDFYYGKFVAFLPLPAQGCVERLNRLDPKNSELTKHI